jgi:hypothetical protein
MALLATDRIDADQDSRRPLTGEAILEPALRLASRHNAHLIGMHVFAGVPAPPVRLPYGSEVVKAMAP